MHQLRCDRGKLGIKTIFSAVVTEPSVLPPRLTDEQPLPPALYVALIRSRRFLWHQHLHGGVIHYTSARKQTGENESLCVESEDALSVILAGLGEWLQVAGMPLNFSLFSSG